MDPKHFLKLKEEIHLREKQIMLILHPGSDSLDLIIDTLYILTNYKNIPGVCVTLVRPYSSLEPLLAKHGVDVDKIVFLDAITRASHKAEHTDRCVYVDNLKDLADMDLYIDAALSAIKSEKKFLFFDSLSTLALFNHIQELSKFFYFLTSKIRLNKVEGIILSVNKDEEKHIITEISKYCDKIIEF